jgi:hypothetical protein
VKQKQIDILDYAKNRAFGLRKFCKLYFRWVEFVNHSFAHVAHFVFLRDVWLRTQRAEAASSRATNLSTHLHELNHPSPSNLATQFHLSNLTKKFPKNLKLFILLANFRNTVLFSTEI